MRSGRQRLSVQHAVDGGAADAESANQLVEALSVLAITQDGRVVETERRLAADVAFLEPSASPAGAHPLDDPIEPPPVRVTEPVDVGLPLPPLTTTVTERDRVVVTLDEAGNF